MKLHIRNLNLLLNNISEIFDRATIYMHRGHDGRKVTLRPHTRIEDMMEGK
jgi:hypothetical protein